VGGASWCLRVPGSGGEASRDRRMRTGVRGGGQPSARRWHRSEPGRHGRERGTPSTSRWTRAPFSRRASPGGRLPDPSPVPCYTSLTRSWARSADLAVGVLGAVGEQRAQAAYVTPRALQLAFRRHLDTTPLTHLRRVRLTHAHDDLRNAAHDAGATVTSIAARCAFTSSLFARRYRDTCGQTPRPPCAVDPCHPRRRPDRATDRSGDSESSEVSGTGPDGGSPSPAA
jgi:AraC-like DNA-binding protein